MMNRGRQTQVPSWAGLLVAIAIGLALPGRAAAAGPATPNLTKLVAEADRVWRFNEQGDAIEAGRQSEAIVRAADALRAGGNLEGAREYYRRAGLVRPWDLDAKIHYAEVLRQLGEGAAARNLAEQVRTYAETDRLLDACRALTGVPAEAALPALANLEAAAGEVLVGLVAAPDTERWLLNDVGRRLSTLLGVRVGVTAQSLAMGGPNRTGRGLLANQVRRTLPWAEPRMKLYVPGGKLVRPESLSDETVLDVMRRLLDREGTPEQTEGYRAQLEEADRQQQWEASLLLSELRARNGQPTGGRIVFLALVPADLFSGTANFLFGSATPNGNYAVVSSHRFAASFTNEPPNRTRLVERTCKQVLSSTGFALGVPRCADPRCARSYPRSLAEHDAKGAGLCEECRAGFAKALGHELPVAE